MRISSGVDTELNFPLGSDALTCLAVATAFYSFKNRCLPLNKFTYFDVIVLPGPNSYIIGSGDTYDIFVQYEKPPAAG